MANKLYAIAKGLTGTVYGLAEVAYETDSSVQHVYRYVGQTYNPRTRERQHLRYAGVKGNPAYSRWMEDLARRGKEPLFIVLEEGIEPDDLDDCESEWIRDLISRGHPLVNQLM